MSGFASRLRRAAGRHWRALTAPLRPQRTQIVYSRQYALDVPGGAIDPRRAERIVAFLLSERLIRSRQLHRPRAASIRSLRLIHSDEYLDSLAMSSSLMPILGFSLPDDRHDGFLLQQRYMVGGTVLAARLALSGNTVAVNLGGGLHHAGRDRGQGFCVFNDIAVAVAQRRAAGFSAPILIVDLDLHDGEGTRRIFAEDSTVHTFSVHNRHLGSTGAIASTAIALPGPVDDDTYLDAVCESLPPVVDGVDPGLAIFVAGTDPAHDDRLGNWSISEAAMLRRDRFVLEALRRRAPTLPVVVVLGGGYGTKTWRYSARFLVWLLGRRDVAPPTGEELTFRRYRRVARSLHAAELTVDPAGDSWEIRPEDLDPSLSGTSRSRFLDYYTRHGLELALERYGALDRLRALGFEHLHLELDLSPQGGDTLRLTTDRDDEAAPVEIRVRRDRSSVPGFALLSIEWLQLQNPRASFPVNHPRLPGQTHPGLGMLEEVFALLVLVCERVGLDGLLIVPAHYHVAVLARRHFRFIDPEVEARFAELAEAVSGLPIHEATAAVETGGVVDSRSGDTFRWVPAPEVLPVDADLKSRIQGDPYRSEVERFRSSISLRLRTTA